MTTSSQHPDSMNKDFGRRSEELLSNEDIIAAACHIREEENAQLHVRPWKSRSRIAWYVAIPAACIVGFVLGYCLQPSATGEVSQGLAYTTTDTIYVHEVVHDTIYQTTDVHHPVRPRPITASAQPSSSKPRKIGVSVLEDGIRYDLLASSPNGMY